ncbi:MULTISPECIES: RIP metalloprotease RseP [Ectothiorhodospira]|uniref:RIP metalloprotease RseP n=1 Tax=Ectothiorhodospira TaxID=1051 RepID=UPI001EE839F1|nr:MULTISPECIES: RIP metalloprotease RseP [Ectothiorhodospira]MCG5493902.1 RIP metalloprotease RseP [Ectothiorhodospira variabilis]MCG5498116.1 RIP metalloprotease RseP [Ectothiorhodospira variabilis]MCG5503705.1 RIP metalloprotease RseP [Ectothiorhodospira variabilis]MCG5506861.1 RIP metalloprotease RseP [Ectothiorhodospira variabilis]MCG5524691.1 RIP metalloprotease RseP [Ectothiorhodospira haloalkaliphila]
MTFLISVLAFVVAIGVLVTVHEFGHYWVARRCGVKVLRFSVGFGRPLWRRVAGKDRTEYVIAAIPLGGYVKMLDEREEPVAEKDLPRAFNRQNVWRRIAIVIAGPTANFLFAIAAFTLMFIVGVSGVKPLVGEVMPGSLAEQAGFERQDEILRVEDKSTPTWELVALNLLEKGLDAREVDVLVRTAGGQEVWRTLDLTDRRQLLADGPLLDKLGMEVWRPWSEPVFGEVLADGAAERAGVRPGDRILSVNGESISSWQAWVEYVRARPDETLDVRLQRNGSPITLTLRTEVRNDGEERIGQIGAWPRMDDEAVEAMQRQVRYGPFTAIALGLERTWDMSVLTLRVMWRLITGEAAASNIAGPVGIAEYAGVSAVIGFSAFLSFLAIVSLSLGIINLLPIPILDGGHLLYYLVEIIKGSPVSQTVEAIGQRIGLVMIAMLMSLALYNDFMRILG